MRLLAVIAVAAAVFAPAAQAETVRAIAVAKPPPNNERRISLVIGNNGYKTSPLRHPVNDARPIGFH